MRSRKKLRPEPDPEDEHDQGRQGGHLAQRKVANRGMGFLLRLGPRFAQRAEEDLLHQLQHVPGPQHHAGDRQHGDHR